MPEPSILALLVAYGPMGIVLAWFLIRFERLPKAFATLSHRIDGLTRAMLLDVASRENCGNGSKRIANEMLAKIEARSEREQED